MNLPSRRILFSVPCLMLLLAASSVAAKQPMAIFHVGNSLTDQAYGMHDIAKARGHETKFGRHMIPGAPLQWLWEHRHEGYRAPDAQKAADDILRDDKWDVLILQPFGRPPENSIEFGVKYAEAAYAGNPDCQVYVFANYPQIGNGQERKDEWEERWLSPTDTRGRATFEKVAKGITAKFPDKQPVKIIPVGEVMYRLHLRMKDGKVPGFEHIADLYADGVHLNSEGKYVEAVTHYAVVFQEDPHGCITSGLRFWKGPYGVHKSFAVFSSISRWSDHGAWGLAEFYDSQPSEYPKLDAVLQWSRRHGRSDNDNVFLRFDRLIHHAVIVELNIASCR